MDTYEEEEEGPEKGERKSQKAVKDMKTGFQLEDNSSIIICGGSKSGKTHFMIECINRFPDLYETSPVSTHYFYGVYQPIFDDLERDYGVIFEQGAPTLDNIDTICDGNTHAIILDDIMEDVVNDRNLCKLFTQYSHHKRLNTYFLTQNLFQKGKYATTITRNADYFVFTKSPRNIICVQNLGKQVGCASAIQEAYNDVLNHKHGILLLDLHSNTSPGMSIFGNIFDEPLIYIPNGYPVPEYIGGEGHTA